jgi:hypothetical protein
MFLSSAGLSATLDGACSARSDSEGIWSTMPENIRQKADATRDDGDGGEAADPEAGAKDRVNPDKRNPPTHRIQNHDTQIW